MVETEVPKTPGVPAKLASASKETNQCFFSCAAQMAVMGLPKSLLSLGQPLPLFLGAGLFTLGWWPTTTLTKWEASQAPTTIC
jgi:hypothetical protein